MVMSIQEETISRARRDLAHRLAIEEDAVTVVSLEETEFSDAALGAALAGEMSAQMITPGWRLRLKAQHKDYEYRSNGKQLRLYNFNGSNYRV